MFEIKLAQGGKPGKGGILPGAKLTPEIAAAHGVVSEVGIIAHSVGVADPWALRRKHVRIVQPDGRSIAMDRLFPPRSHQAPEISDTMTG